MGGLAVGNPPTTKPSTNALAGESPIVGNSKKQEFCQNCFDKPSTNDYKLYQLLQMLTNYRLVY